MVAVATYQVRIQGINGSTPWSHPRRWKPTATGIIRPHHRHLTPIPPWCLVTCFNYTTPAMFRYLISMLIMAMPFAACFPVRMNDSLDPLATILLLCIFLWQIPTRTNIWVQVSVYLHRLPPEPLLRIPIRARRIVVILITVHIRKCDFQKIHALL